MTYCMAPFRNIYVNNGKARPCCWYERTKLNNKIETIFMVADGNYSHISSSLIKDIIRLGGDASNFIPKIVEKELRKKLLKKG